MYCIACLSFFESKWGGERQGATLATLVRFIYLVYCLASWVFCPGNHYHYRAGGSVIIGLAVFQCCLVRLADF
jgi:hypothetical protein